jgi:tetratricopeptide (TPR) repeat protein
MPNDAPTGQELFERGDFVGAEAAFRVAVKANREDASALNDLGRALEAQGKLGDATVEYEKAYKRWKELGSANTSALRNRASALLGWGEMLNEQRAFENAALKFDEALKIRGVTGLEAWLHHGRGRALAGQCLFNKAIQEFEKARRLLEGKPDCRYVLWSLGATLIQDEKLEEACKCFEEAVKLHPTGDSIGHFYYGLALSKCGRAEDALNEYEEAIITDQSRPYAHNAKADLLFRLGRYKDGWNAWNEAKTRFEDGKASLEEKPGASGPKQSGGSKRLRKSEAVNRAVYFADALRDVFIEYKTSKEWYELALKNTPDHLGALCGLAILFRRWSRGDSTNVEIQMRASQATRVACERLKADLHRADRYNSLLVLADIYIEDRDWPRVRESLDCAQRECNEMRGRQAETLVRRGILCLGTDEPDEAARFFRQSLIDRAGDLNLQGYLGLALLNAKQYNSALSAFRRILDVAPGNIDALIGSALASIELADDGDADHYERAEQFLTDALNHGRGGGSGSKRLARDKDAIADIYYMRGYAKAKRYEANRGALPTILIASALDDFRQTLRANSRHNLARSAIDRLTQRMLRRFGDSFAEIAGQVVVFIASASVFLFAQLDFFLRNTALHRALGLPAGPLLDGPGYYVSVTFGALVIMIAGLSLPKLLTLKVPGIELKKASADEVAFTSSLGVRRFGVFENFVLGSLQGLNATLPR